MILGHVWTSPLHRFGASWLICPIKTHFKGKMPAAVSKLDMQQSSSSIRRPRSSSVPFVLDLHCCTGSRIRCAMATDPQVLFCVVLTLLLPLRLHSTLSPIQERLRQPFGSIRLNAAWNVLCVTLSVLACRRWGIELWQRGPSWYGGTRWQGSAQNYMLAALHQRHRAQRGR